MDRVLVVAGEERQRAALESLLLDEGHRVVLADGLDAALPRIREDQPGLVLLVLSLPGASGLEALAAVHRVAPRLPVLVVAAVGTTQEAIEATKAGAFDYFLEPFDDDDLLRSVAHGLEAGRLMRSPVAIVQDGGSARGEALIGRSKPMQEIYKAIGRVAPTDATVLIRGESGTGKELVARAVYQHSSRAGKPFVVVNCVAIPDTLIESELFGFERGAFTGAVSRRIGKVEQADGGTLFLDEIGDVPLAVQAKLLRLLEDRHVERIGGHQPVPVDVRIITATNRDLEAAIAEGRFRKDLFYRLNVVPMTLPPLRERPDDVPLLCDYLLEQLTLELGIRNPGLAPEAYPLLCSHSWPGNVRELANLMEQSLIFGRGRRIGSEEVLALLGNGPVAATDGSSEVEQAVRGWVRRSLAAGRDRLLPALVDQVTRQTIVEVLEAVGGNHARAARVLGISRPTLLARMTRYRLR